MTQNTQSSVEIDREIFFLCSTLINKKIQMARQYEGVNPKWRGDTNMSHRWPAGGFIQGTELKGPGLKGIAQKVACSFWGGVQAGRG